MSITSKIKVNIVTKAKISKLKILPNRLRCFSYSKSKTTMTTMEVITNTKVQHQMELKSNRVEMWTSNHLARPKPTTTANTHFKEIMRHILEIFTLWISLSLPKLIYKVLNHRKEAIREWMIEIGTERLKILTKMLGWFITTWRTFWIEPKLLMK